MQEIRLLLLTATPDEFDGLANRLDQVLRWGHALMRAPHWQNARQGRKALNQFTLALRCASDLSADLGGEDDAFNLLQRAGLSLPGAPHRGPYTFTEPLEDW